MTNILQPPMDRLHVASRHLSLENAPERFTIAVLDGMAELQAMKSLHMLRHVTTWQMNSTRKIAMSSDGSVINELKRNHEKADTKIILHSLYASRRGATQLHIHSPDTDVFILSLWWSKYFPQDTMFVTGVGQHRRKINLSKVTESLEEEEVCGYHAHATYDEDTLEEVDELQRMKMETRRAATEQTEVNEIHITVDRLARLARTFRKEGVSPRETRGGMDIARCKYQMNVTKSIIKHIGTYKYRENHYGQAKSVRHYLSPEQSMKKMWCLWTSQQEYRLLKWGQSWSNFFESLSDIAPSSKVSMEKANDDGSHGNPVHNTGQFRAPVAHKPFPGVLQRLPAIPLPIMLGARLEQWLEICGAIFQQDNVQPHMERVAQGCLHHVQILPWSTAPLTFPQSSMCGTSLNASIHDLEHTVQQLWACLNQEIIKHLFDSMPDHAAACIAANQVPFLAGLLPGFSHLGIVQEYAADLICTVQHHGGNTARLARRRDEALGMRVSVAHIAPSLLHLGSMGPSHSSERPFLLCAHKGSPSGHHLHTAFALNVEGMPETYEEAMQDEEQRKAINNELRCTEKWKLGKVECEEKTMKLRSALYGLWDDPECWNKRFNETMLKLNFKHSSHDYCAPKKVGELVSALEKEFSVTEIKNLTTTREQDSSLLQVAPNRGPGFLHAPCNVKIADIHPHKLFKNLPA
ncbi:hypothetical protein PR048_011102 [Dryococelus australis]|uniref:Uncharacterized protein n=1 Tax=Dryococelus australis TaxID=614101 RepID=A0ABQ9HKP1_9NEOP|nr:hypothetical protein PR048_011102 [Dryococelus australis]